MLGLSVSKVLLFVSCIIAFLSTISAVPVIGTVASLGDDCHERCMDYYYCMNYNEDEKACAWKKKDCTCNRG
ncbi:hypothetical protein QR680_004032 [Steinernema hermaphroditum]|uniref:Uncharacterized protein n=1 Tax=Steinernema hermaphroditum TaxID=289476 RepID=A0AA39LT37_9BILA|nr:hypothetical protein QR680_004032 [Steinernema hermaphroditum]